MDCLADSESEEEEAEEVVVEKKSHQNGPKSHQKWNKNKKKATPPARRPLRGPQTQRDGKLGGERQGGAPRSRPTSRFDQQRLTSFSKEMDYYKPVSERGRGNEGERRIEPARVFPNRERETHSQFEGQSQRSLSTFSSTSSSTHTPHRPQSSHRVSSGRDKEIVKGVSPAAAHLHPSWEAKKKLKKKEITSISLVPSQGKKIKFDE